MADRCRSSARRCSRCTSGSCTWRRHRVRLGVDIDLRGRAVTRCERDPIAGCLPVTACVELQALPGGIRVLLVGPCSGRGYQVAACGWTFVRSGVPPERIDGGVVCRVRRLAPEVELGHCARRARGRPPRIADDREVLATRIEPQHRPVARLEHRAQPDRHKRGVGRVGLRRVTVQAGRDVRAVGQLHCADDVGRRVGVAARVIAEIHCVHGGGPRLHARTGHSAPAHAARRPRPASELVAPVDGHHVRTDRPVRNLGRRPRSLSPGWAGQIDRRAPRDVDRRRERRIGCRTAPPVHEDARIEGAVCRRRGSRVVGVEVARIRPGGAERHIPDLGSVAEKAGGRLVDPNAADVRKTVGRVARCVVRMKIRARHRVREVDVLPTSESQLHPDGCEIELSVASARCGSGNRDGRGRRERDRPRVDLGRGTGWVGAPERQARCGLIRRLERF